MIIDELSNSYKRLIDLYNLSINYDINNNNDKNNVSFQKLCYIILKIKELINDIDEFSFEIGNNNINSLNTEQLDFIEKMKFSQDMINKYMPLIIKNEVCNM